MPSLRTLDLVLLRTFVAVAETGSISAAGRLLHLTQGGISQQIMRLERFLECQLLQRDPRGARLTENGAQFLPKAQRLLELNDSVCEEMVGLSGSEVVRVGVPYDLAGSHFAPVLKTFSRRYRDVQVTVVTGSSVDLMSDLSKGLVDVIIGQCPGYEGGGERLALEPLVWISASGNPSAERPLPLCFVTPTCTFRRTVFPLLAQARIDWRVVFENASVDTTLATVQSGLALTPWLRSLVPAGFQILGEESGLPSLPAFALELHVSATARRGALGMARIIRDHYLQASSAG